MVLHWEHLCGESAQQTPSEEPYRGPFSATYFNVTSTIVL
eukprot:COSAG02_NODE_33850_length_493_cov_0.982234_1_plen_39_part_10